VPQPYFQAVNNRHQSENNKKEIGEHDNSSPNYPRYWKNEGRFRNGPAFLLWPPVYLVIAEPFTIILDLSPLIN